jgi:hypothetical protein
MVVIYLLQHQSMMHQHTIVRKDFIPLYYKGWWMPTVSFGIMILDGQVVVMIRQYSKESN